MVSTGLCPFFILRRPLESLDMRRRWAEDDHLFGDARGEAIPKHQRVEQWKEAWGQESIHGHSPRRTGGGVHSRGLG